MYVAVDTGASKTLLGLFHHQGELLTSRRFPTPAKGPDFLHELTTQLEELMKNRSVRAIVIALPGIVEDGRLVAGGVLSRRQGATNGWGNLEVASYITKRVELPVAIENDAALAGLAEANLGAGQGSPSVLYLSISTGIGSALIIDGRIPPQLRHSEAGQMLQWRQRKWRRFEDIASGWALHHQYGHIGSEITDPSIWQEFAHELSIGLFNIITVLVPSLVVLGGGMSVNFAKFHPALEHYLKEHNPGLFPTPPVVQARYPETAVLYGGYILAKDQFE